MSFVWSHLHAHFESDAFFHQQVAPAVKFSARQQVLDRILEQIPAHDLLGKSYVKQYLRHK
jgi:hypothetical protein